MYKYNAYNTVVVPAVIAAKNHVPHLLVLNRKTQSIKLNRIGIIASKLVNKEKIPHKGKSNKNIIKMKGGVSCQQGGCAMIGNGNGATATDGDGVRVREAGEEYTI
jgi:hypothetical protein